VSHRKADFSAGGERPVQGQQKCQGRGKGESGKTKRFGERRFGKKLDGRGEPSWGVGQVLGIKIEERGNLLIKTTPGKSTWRHSEGNPG